MPDFVRSGGVTMGNAIIEVKADSDGNPTECCNPVTGVCLGGGGGDSDFSTAEVTITNAGNGIIIANTELGGSNGGVFEAATIDAILYKGVALAAEVNEALLVINSGSAEYLTPDDRSVVKITGVCSIGVETVTPV